MLRLIIVLHVVESIEFVEDKNLLIHRTLGADRTAYSLSIRIYGDSSQLSFFVSSFRERLIVLATFSERNNEHDFVQMLCHNKMNLHNVSKVSASQCNRTFNELRN